MTLIELLIAMVVMALGISAIVAGFGSGLLSVGRAREASTVGTLADKQMEIYRQAPFTSLTPGTSERRSADRLGRAHVLGRIHHRLDLRRRTAEHDDEHDAADLQRHAGEPGGQGRLGRGSQGLDERRPTRVQRERDLRLFNKLTT